MEGFRVACDLRQPAAPSVLSPDAVVTSAPITFSFSTSSIFFGLLERDSVQQFEAHLNAPKRGNRVMMSANFDYDRPGMPAKTNTCSFDLSCRHQSLPA
jgi:hypothetical protein